MISKCNIRYIFNKTIVIYFVLNLMRFRLICRLPFTSESHRGGASGVSKRHICILYNCCFFFVFGKYIDKSRKLIEFRF